eukprot:9500669-Pyramimonas_sp.AAC.1
MERRRPRKAAAVPQRRRARSWELDSLGPSDPIFVQQPLQVTVQLHVRSGCTPTSRREPLWILSASP